MKSVELISIIKRLNEGFTHEGKSIKSATGFVVGCTFNPNARNLDSQVNRLERKVAADAQYAMTQPVVDVHLIEEPNRARSTVYPYFHRCLAAPKRTSGRVFAQRSAGHRSHEGGSQRHGGGRGSGGSRTRCATGEGTAAAALDRLRRPLSDHAVSPVRDNRGTVRVCAWPMT